jgi:hypothetical protein
VIENDREGRMFTAEARRCGEERDWPGINAKSANGKRGGEADFQG